jgi:hypothetical protein
MKPCKIKIRKRSHFINAVSSLKTCEFGILKLLSILEVTRVSKL